MLINNFTGGLSRYISPNLINKNESVKCTNVDLLKGRLSPIKSDLFFSDDVSWLNKPNFYWFEGNWVKSNQGTSFATFNNVLYYSTGVGSIKFTKNGSDIFDLGIEAPTTALTVTSGVQPTTVLTEATEGVSELPSARYEYKIVYYNGDEYKSEDISINYSGSNGITITISGILTLDRVYIYRLYESKYKLVYNTSTTSTDVVHTDGKLNISNNTTLSYLSGYTEGKLVQYCYTYYSSVYGYESAPSPYTELTEILGDAIITGFSTTLNPIVDQYRLYRIGGNITNLTLVEAYSTTTVTVTDIKTDLEIAENDLLTTIGLTKPPEGMNYLTLYSSTLFASIGSKLYFSETALPNNWSELNTIELPDQIMGIGATQNGLLIFNRNKTFLLRGTDASNFSLLLLNGEQGCIDHSTINYVNNMLVWLSLDGICSSIGAGITVMTEQRLGKLSLSSYGSVVSNSKYYLFHTTGTYVLDFRTGALTISEIDTTFKGGHYSYFYDSLFLYTLDDTIVRFGEGESNRQLNYKTGWLADFGTTNIKVYKDLYFYVLGTLELKVYLDTNLVSTSTLTNGFNNVKVPQDFQKAYFFECEFTGTGELVELEFKIEERQNGR